MTGVNFHQGQSLSYNDRYIAAWGIHPADVVEHPLAIGGGLWFKKRTWGVPVKTDNFIRLTSQKPVKKASTIIIAASSREEELNSEQKFFGYMKKK